MTALTDAHVLTAEANSDHDDRYVPLHGLVACHAGITVRVEYHPGAEETAAKRLTAAYRDVMRQLGAEVDQ